jgi:hypothetical protein
LVSLACLLLCFSSSSDLIAQAEIRPKRVLSRRLPRWRESELAPGRGVSYSRRLTTARLL